MKGYLAAGSPVIFGAYLTDGVNDPDYDHIEPAVGFSSTGYLTYFNLYYLTPMVLSFAQLNATRKSCARSLVQGGCIPNKVDYGAAVTGVIDANHVTLPVRLDVNRPDDLGSTFGWFWASCSVGNCEALSSRRRAIYSRRAAV